VVSGSPAAKAGVKSGDVIVRLDDRKIVVVEDIFVELREHKPGETVTLELKRNGDTKTVEVKLGNLEQQ
jgi:putative serine protease PepD